MPLTMEQYASYLDGAGHNWPAPPEIDRPKARPHLAKLSGVRAVTWNVYGTLLGVTTGDLLFEHPQKFVMDIALDKTIQEFKMWGSMSRKPGQPTDYLARVYGDLLTDLRLVPGGTEKHPEVASDRLWEAFIKKLLQKDYKFDATFYGSLNEFARKVAYFFHASLQTPVAQPGAAKALQAVADAGLTQCLLADGQCFTPVQLQRCVARQKADLRLENVMALDLSGLSYEVRGRKPSERLFRHVLDALLEKKDIGPDEVLHVGSRLTADIVPAKRLGMKTALYAGDKGSLQATPEQLKEAASRPDVMLTDLSQVAEILPRR